MAPRKQILTLLEGGTTDVMPWAFYSAFIPRGQIEREIRNKGCGIILWEPAWRMKMQNVEVSVRGDVEPFVQQGDWGGKRIKTIIRTYHTPLGCVSEKISIDPSYHSPWIVEHLIKNIQDYKVLKFIIENTDYHEAYSSFADSREDLGQDGVIYASAGPSPLPRLLNYHMGLERLCIDIYSRPNQVEELLYLLEEKQNEIFRIAADSPAKIVHSDDNVTGDILPPRLIEKYSVPFYNKQANLLHQKNKIYAVHMDGKLKNIKDLIEETKIDLIDSFTLPEQGGDLSIEEALNIWKDKVIAINFPASIGLKGKDETEKFMLKLLKRIFPAKNFMLEISEDLPHTLWKDIVLILNEIIPKFRRR